MKQRYIYSLLFFAFLMAGFKFANAQWSKLYSYPEGGNIKDIASDNSGRIYVLAGFLNNIYYTQNNGQSWSLVNNLDSYWNILDIEVDKSNGTLYVGTSGEGIVWTPDLGNTWNIEYISTDPTSGFHASFLAVGSKHNGNVIVGSDADFISTPIYTTINGGDTWTIQPNAPFGGALDFEFLPNGDLLAATENGVFKSATNGASWTALNNGISNMQTRCLAYKQSNGYLFAGTDINGLTGDTTGVGVFVSINNGASWTLSSNGITNRKVRSVLVDNTTGNIYAGTEGGIFLSTNNGASWSAVNMDLQSVAITGLANNSSGVFSASEKSGVAFSANPPAGWTYKNSGMFINTIGSMTTDAVSNIYVLDEEVSGVYKNGFTTNAWQQSAPNQLPAFFGKKIINHNDTLYATFSTQSGLPKSGVYTSTDQGITWTDISATIPIPASVNWVSYDDIEVADGVIYVYVNAEVFRSTNYGATWVSIRQGGISDIDVAPDGTLYLTVVNFLFVQVEILSSTNQGATFNPVNIGSLSLSVNANMVINRNGALYIKNNNNIYQQNGPGNWTALPNGGWGSNFIINIYFDNANGIYASIFEGGIFYSPNGTTWNNVSAGIPDYYSPSVGGTVMLTLIDFIFDQNNIPYARSSDAEAGILSGIYTLGGALPVNFLDITAVKTGSGQRVSWKVAEELTIESYEVERSDDGRKFHTVSVIAVSGSSGVEKTYSLTDVQQFSGMVYYRIKAVDKDGSFRYSNIAILKAGKMDMQITVYPNPVRKGLLNMRLENAPAGDYHLSIIDNAGKKIYSDVLSNASGGTLVLSRYISALLTAGTYTVIVKHGHQSFNKRIVVADF